MNTKILFAVAITLNAIYAKAQPAWDKIDLHFQGNISTQLSNCIEFAKVNDSTFAVLSSFTNSNAHLQTALVNVKTGMVTIIDTFSNFIYPGRMIVAKNKLFGCGVGLREYNFTLNKWDSISDFRMLSNYTHQKNNMFKISNDSLILFGLKIAKFNVNNYALRVVSDSSYLERGGCITNKNYYAFHTRGGSQDDSVFLMVSTDNGDHWNLRRRLNGNYDAKRYFFVNSDTGYISYVTKPGTPPNSRQCHVLRTYDGGNTWPDTIKYFQQTLGNIWGVNEIYFLDRNVGFVSYGSSIFKTIDGGNSWFETQGMYIDGLNVFFNNDSVGFAAVGKFYPTMAQYILKTTTQGGPPYKAIDRSGISKVEAGLVNVKIYPNPNKGQFTVTTPGLRISRIKVYDNNSKLIFDEAYSNDTHKQKISLFDLASGVYYVHIFTKEIPTIFTKFIVQ